ncbi:UDP-glycosyltransferase 74E2 [Linum grandiflorum]
MVNDVVWDDEGGDVLVVYVSFGSLAILSPQQTDQELCFGLKNINYYFLWVVIKSEVTKLRKDYLSEHQVLTSHKVGCFVTHCGWNSTLEALSLGIPMVAMPHWRDQLTNAKFINNVWKTGERNEKEIVMIKRKMIGRCIRQVMEGEENREMLQIEPKRTSNWIGIFGLNGSDEAK